MMDITPKYPNAAISKKLIGGNALGIAVAVRKALEKVGAPEEEFEAYAAEAWSGNYDHVLQTTARWVGFKR